MGTLGGAMSKAAQLAKGIKELRMIYCHQSESGVQMKNFIQSTYPALKASNPDTPILIRNATGVQPAMYARYAMGKESKVDLVGKDAKAIAAALEQLNSQA